MKCIALCLILTAVQINAMIIKRSLDYPPELRESLIAQNERISSLLKRIEHENPKIGLPGPIPIDIEQIKKIITIIQCIGSQVLPPLVDPNGDPSPYDNVENAK